MVVVVVVPSLSSFLSPPLPHGALHHIPMVVVVVVVVVVPIPVRIVVIPIPPHAP